MSLYCAGIYVSSRRRILRNDRAFLVAHNVDFEFLAVAVLHGADVPTRHARRFDHLVLEFVLGIDRLHTEIRQDGLHDVCNIRRGNGASV